MASIGPGGRLLQTNSYPIQLTPSFILSLGTANGDVFTTLIMPSQGRVKHSTLTNSNPGTGTDTPTVQWYSGAGATGLQLTTPFVDKNGALVDLDVGGIVYAAAGTQLGMNVLDEGKQLFLNVTFGGGTHTAGGSWELSIFLVL